MLDNSKRIVLSVPPKDNYTLELLGAEWDNNIKRWCVTSNNDVGKFVPWMPPATKNLELTTIYSPLFLIRSYIICFACIKEAEVWCFAANKIKFDKDIIEGDKDQGSFFMQYIETLPGCLLSTIQEKTSFYFLDKEKDGVWYYANHCNHCGAILKDHEIFHPEEAFIATQEISCIGVSIKQLPHDKKFKLPCKIVTTDHNLIWQYAERIN